MVINVLRFFFLLAEDCSLIPQVTTLPRVGLALHIHIQTRSKELIRMISKFGHSINYDDTQ